MPTHTATLRAIHRAPTRRLITLTLDDGTTTHFTYRHAAQLGFWLKSGQRIKRNTLRFQSTGHLHLAVVDLLPTHQ